MFGFLDKRRKTLKSGNKSQALNYYDDYMVWLAGSGEKDTWTNFVEYFDKVHNPKSWLKVADAYETFMKASHGMGTNGRSQVMWVSHRCETYGSDAYSAAFFDFAANYQEPEA